jgi:hypothetical protein
MALITEVICTRTSFLNLRKIFLRNKADTIALFNTSRVRTENAVVIS